MRERADQYEGPLNSTEARANSEGARAYVKRVTASDLKELLGDEKFLRWFQRFMYPALMQDVPVNNGSALAQFMGRRQLILEQMREMDALLPGGVMPKLIEARVTFQQDLALAVTGQPKEQ